MLKNCFLIVIVIFTMANANQSESEIKIIENNATNQIYINQLFNTKTSNNNDKLFIREYTYVAGEDDSKNSSRNKAIEQIKILLSEEIGTHIESYLEIKKQDINGVSSQSIKKEIQSLSVGIAKLKLLDEIWNGKTYYIKASVQINEKQTMELLLQSIKSKATQKDVERLNKILEEQKELLSKQNNEVENIHKKLITQEIINEASKNDVLEMKQQLIKYNLEEIQQQEEAKKYKTEIERKKLLIKELNSKSKDNTKKQIQEWLNKRELLCAFEVGTSIKDIERIASVSISSRNYRYYPYDIEYFFYGNKKFQYTACPDSFLEKLGSKCVYFNFANYLMTEKAGCELTGNSLK